MSGTTAIPKDLRKVWKLLKKQGWKWELTRGDHIRFIPPSGGDYVVTGQTASDWRSSRNLVSELRRRGARFPKGFRP